MSTCQGPLLNLVVTSVGNGANTLFWSDTWLQGKAIADLAPNLIACISKWIINKRQCSRSMFHKDIRVSSCVNARKEYLDLWDLIFQVHLTAWPTGQALLEAFSFWTIHGATSITWVLPGHYMLCTMEAYLENLGTNKTLLVLHMARGT